MYNVTREKQENLVRFEALTYGDFFLYGNSLYMKIDTDDEDCYLVDKDETPNEETIVVKFNAIHFGKEMLFFETMDNLLVESVDVDIVIK